MADGQPIFGNFNDEPEFDDMIRAGKAIRDRLRGSSEATAKVG